MSADAPSYGWSGLDAAGRRLFVPGAAPAAPKLTDLATYPTRAAFDTARVPVPVPSLADAQAAQLAALDRACAAAITSGFASAALGQPHTYGSRPSDQANLDADMMAAATAGAAQGWTATIACADATGTWSAVGHTAAQVSTAWNDFRAWRIAQQAKRRTLAAQVQAATTVATVQAVTW